MDIKTVEILNKFNLLVLLLVFCADFAHATALVIEKPHTASLANLKSSMKSEEPTANLALTGPPFGDTRDMTNEATYPSSLVQLKRSKRNAVEKANADAMASFQYLFPANVNDDSLRQWLIMLAKPRTTDWANEEYIDDEFEDDPPALDIHKGRQPGSLKFSKSSENRNGAWASEESTPIVLHQHRMSKKAISGIAPELILRETASPNARPQPEPYIMRKLLTRIMYPYKAVRSSDFDNRNGPLHYVGQEHSTRVNNDTPAASRTL